MDVKGTSHHAFPMYWLQRVQGVVPRGLVFATVFFAAAIALGCGSESQEEASSDTEMDAGLNHDSPVEGSVEDSALDVGKNERDWWRVAGGTAKDLHGVWGAGPSDVWVVGNEGTTLHWDGTGWTSVPSGTSSDLRAMHGLASNAIWAVGKDGVVLRWNGTKWLQNMAPPSSNIELRAIWAVTADDIWVSGSDPKTGNGTTLRWDGKAWSEHWPSESSHWPHGMWASGIENVWGVGGGGFVHRWDGSSWSPVIEAKTSQPDLHAVFGTAQDDVWAVGDGDPMHWDGTSWTAMPMGWGASRLYALTALSATHAWAVGEQGACFHWDGISWLEQQTGVDGDLRGIWAASPYETWAVGAEGTILRRQGHPSTDELTDPCAEATTCDACAALEGCGWCNDAAGCMTGAASGPPFGACIDWRWGSLACERSGFLATEPDFGSVTALAVSMSYPLFQNGKMPHPDSYQVNDAVLPEAYKAARYRAIVIGKRAENTKLASENSRFSHCSGFVGTIINNMVDPQFPGEFAASQQEYMETSAVWVKVGSTAPGEYSPESYLPGDVLNNPTHTFLWIGDYLGVSEIVAEASWGGGTKGRMGGLRISPSRGSATLDAAVFDVWRFVGNALFDPAPILHMTPDYSSTPKLAISLSYPFYAVNAEERNAAAITGWSIASTYKEEDPTEKGPKYDTPLASDGYKEATMLADEKGEKVGNSDKSNGFANCSAFTGTVIKNTVDPKFPGKLCSLQVAYMKKAGSNWKQIGSTETGKYKPSDYKPGDIIISDIIGHTFMWIGDYGGEKEVVAEAAFTSGYLPTLRINPAKESDSKGRFYEVWRYQGNP